MDGDDLHQRGVALQPQHRVLAARRIGDAGGEPGQQRRHALAAFALLLDQLGQVAEIGQPPLAVRQRQKPLRRPFAGEIMPPGGHEAMLAPALVVVGILQQLALPARFVFQFGLDPRGVEAGQLGGQRAPQPALVGRFGPGVQQGQHLARLAAGEHALLGQRHAGHPARAQLAPHPVALAVGGHQHRDVAAGQPPPRRALDDGGAVLARQRQQAGDLVGAGFRRRLLGRLLAQFLFVGR
ncbi:Uncharacterised protein [Chromobacterium violaceum]|uniref:Uncharacterized protein n=1 Tax=Chromobacterium violaceum TaxID=536 RepID=A0AAX2M3E3_CHRVL|nr:Uncharacterised protein [Chromobacterium violaceum]